MLSGGVAAAAALIAAPAAVALLTRPLLRWLPEPADGDGKVPYAALGTRRFVAGCAVLAGLAVALPLAVLPAVVQPLWWVLGVPVLLLTAIDLRTTWLPLRLTRLAWVAMVAAALVTAQLGGGWPLLGRVGAGAAGVALLYLALWRLSGRGIGFGDVRFAPLVGAATAAVDASMVLTALLLGSMAGAAHGVARWLRGRREPFAYAPAIWAGAYLACLLRWLVG